MHHLCHKWMEVCVCVCVCDRLTGVHFGNFANILDTLPSSPLIHLLSPLWLQFLVLFGHHWSEYAGTATRVPLHHITAFRSVVTNAFRQRLFGLSVLLGAASLHPDTSIIKLVIVILLTKLTQAANWYLNYSNSLVWLPAKLCRARSGQNIEKTWGWLTNSVVKQRVRVRFFVQKYSHTLQIMCTLCPLLSM